MLVSECSSQMEAIGSRMNQSQRKAIRLQNKLGSMGVEQDDKMVPFVIPPEEIKDLVAAHLASDTY